MGCPKCGRDTVTIDYPYPEVYHNEDTEWGVQPMTEEDPHDPGWLVAKKGTVPARFCGKEKEK